MTFLLLLQVLGLSLDVYGVVLMAYSYFSSVPLNQIPRYLLRSLSKKELGVDVTESPEAFTASLSAKVNGERIPDFIRGLAWVIIGFVIQMFVVICNIVMG